jgi:hypothetical protein
MAGWKDRRVVEVQKEKVGKRRSGSPDHTAPEVLRRAQRELGRTSVCPEKKQIARNSPCLADGQMDEEKASTLA